MMRLILMITFLQLSPFVKAQYPGYQVLGKVSGLGTSKLLVLHLKGEELPILDTVEVNNDRFQFSGYATDPYLVQILRFSSDWKTKKLTEFMLENSVIRVSGKSPSYEDVRIKGSKSDMILKEYLANDNELSSNFYSPSSQKFDSNWREEINLEDGDDLATSRVKLLKSYVKKFADQSVGSLLPNFCLLEEGLTLSDYSEIFQLLDPHIQRSFYGRLIQEKSQNQ